MIAIVDYGMSNLRSVQRGLERVGAAVRVVTTAAELDGARGIVLPGDGAFGQTMENLVRGGWVEPLCQAIRRGVPFLGICLGMQLLFETSDEMGDHQGLGLLRGRVVKFPSGKVPQIGWNQVQRPRESRLMAGVPDGSYVYFVHSYYCEPGERALVAAETEYGLTYASAVERDNIWGAQFHPEKSGEVGLAMLRNFSRMVG
ncbi:MAG: imidazole glycerol phosphate synthase subunit HisH [Anaerolineae bacterium]